jgi:hypothetical protein
VKAFKNVTNQGNEPAVKKAVNLPDDSINLGWFNSGEITPEMHLSVSDLSGLIPENLVPVSTSEIDTVMYADEFGVLRYVKTNQEMNQQFGSPIVANSEVSISNYILNKQQTDLNFNYTGRIVDLESEMFIHSYYVSNYFALLDSSVSNYNGMEKSSELREPAKAGIQVVDSSGNNFVDSNGKNNYRIILEKYTNHRSVVGLSGTIYQGLDLYRIIILLEQVDPQDLYLIYNKYEKNEDNIPYNPFFGYKEKINTIQYYKPVAEESEVIDPSSSERKVYSTQLFSYKENELLKNKISNDGWKVYAPRKAIQDPRTFQSFNWRLLAKINYNYANVRNVYAESERATLKVGVLYSGQVSQVKNPYVFANMEESVFNLENYLFQNPIAASANNKSQKNYWLVNIDDNTIDYSKFDILVWTPTQPITDLQGSAINRALSLNASVFIDASLISAGFSYLGIDLFIPNTYTSTGFLTVQDTYKNGNTTMNAWDLNEFNESSTSTKPRYSIFGKRTDVLNNDSVVSLRTFSGPVSAGSSSVALVSVDSKAVIIKRSLNTQGILPPSLVVSANPFLYLTNDIVKADGSSVANNGDTNAFPVGTVGNQTSAVSTLAIGPNKFFYNYLSDVNNNKVNNFARNNTTDQSTILWNVSPWRNLWTINGTVSNGQVTVLSELEKQEYNFSFKNAIGSTEQKFCREIHPSISGILLADFEGTLNGQDAESIINADFSNVEFYLECTNPNVKFLNFTDFSSTLSAGGNTLLGQANSSYKIFKLDTQAFKQITANPPSAVSLNAYSTVNSNEFNFSSISYPYAILGASEYNSRTDSAIKTPTDFLPGSQDVRDYNFAFKTSISINEITKTVNSYKINWSTNFSSAIGGSADFKNVVFKPKGGTAGISKSNFSISEVQENKVQIKQTFSPFNKYYYPGKAFSKTDIVSADQTETESSFNNFHYTGDIDVGNRWDEYFAGKDSFSTTGTTTTNTASSVPISTNTTVTTTKGAALSNATIKAAIIAAKQSDGSYETGTINYMTSGVDVPIGFWSTLVWKNGDAITLSAFFNKWLDTFAQSKFPTLVLRQPAIDNYIASTQASFIADQFIAANSPIYLATESVTLGGVSPGKVFTSTTTTSTVSRPTTRNGYSADFVKYVQYTLLKMGYKITVDGLYGSSTGTQIRLFQHNAGLGFVDGIVDSQTKSVLATYWLNLYKNNNAKYNDIRADAPTGSQKYISAAVKYSDISNIGIPGKEYRRISFTGVPGPTVLEDYIFFKVPQKANDQLLHSVTISTGEWAVRLGELEVFTSDLDLQKFYQRKKERINIPGVLPVFVAGSHGVINKNSSKVIDFGGAEYSRGLAKWIGIKMYSRKINDSKFGPNAEGFSIKDIEFGISSPTIDIPPVYGGTSTFTGTAYGTIAGYAEIQSSDEALIDFSTISNMISKSNVTSINLSKIDFTMSQAVDGVTVTKTVSQAISSSEQLRYSSATNKLGNTISFKYEDVDVVVNGLDQSNSLEVSSTAIVDSYRLNGTAAPTSISNSDFSLTKVSERSNFYVLKTVLGVGYESKETSPKVTVSSYYIADADNLSSRQNAKLSINVKDGIVVLTDVNGMPTGFPNFNSYIPTAVNSVANFGFLNLIWNYSSPAPYGLDWGFYNVSTKKFLGKKISYLEYMNQPGLDENTRGPNNVYIGLNAFDSDMDIGTQDNIVGTTVRAPQTEANRPTRYICPLYSVKVKSRSKIKVSSPPKALSKFDTWFVNVGVGKFIKEITIPLNYNFTNWMKEYKGEKLKCYYDTTQIKTPSSSIFGNGYYDIYDEHPQIISDNTISLRYGSVHCVQEQYDKNLYSSSEYTDASPIVPWIFVSIKNAKGKWINIPRKEIKDFDKNTGRITFKKEIVPLNSKDIEVSYTVKNPDLMVHQINGEIIPLNPFLAAEDNSPIFMYLLPIRCEELVNGVYSAPSGFVSDGPLKFTRDSTIFNSASTKYNPLALHMATINVNNNYTFENVSIEDMRIKGGGLKYSVDITKKFAEDLDVASYSDTYTGMSFLHPNGGYVIIQIPQEVMSNFNSRDEIYSIVRNNLTAGVSFDIQDVDGNDWRTISNAQ